MEITKYEKIIFQERDIESAKSVLKRWLEYAEGNRDVYTENSRVLSDCEETIKALEHEIGNLPDEPISWESWIYDIYYENDFDSHDDFVTNYQTVLRQNAQTSYNDLIEYYSPENAKLRVDKAKEDLNRKQSRLNLMMGELSLLEKIRLNYTRQSPMARINSSPSFISSHSGDLFAEGFAEGLNKAN